MADDLALLRASVHNAARALCGDVGGPCHQCCSVAREIVAEFLDRLPGCVSPMSASDLARSVRRACSDA